MTNVNYRIVLSTNQVQAFEKLELAMLFAKQNHVEYIDVVERSTGEVVDFIKVNIRRVRIFA